MGKTIYLPPHPWPRLSEDLKGPRHPDRCQKCGKYRHEVEYLIAWQECDEDDQPEPIIVMLCDGCNKDGTTPSGRRQKGIVERHPRFYVQLPRNAPFPGAMSICGGCAWRDGTRCRHPEAKINGGPGTLKIMCSPPETFHITTSPRSMSGFYTVYALPPRSCSGREEEYPEAAIEGLMQWGDGGAVTGPVEEGEDGHNGVVSEEGGIDADTAG